MIADGVNFCESEVKKMTKEEFLEQMMPVFFQDRKPEKRKKILTDIYERITKKP